MGIIRTVTGDIAPGDAGVTLVHEHVIVDTAEILGDPDLRVNDPVVAAQELDIPGPLKIQTVVNATPREMGSNPQLVLETARISRKYIVQGTGFFRQATYPDFVAELSVEELAQQMIEEITSGIAGTRVRAGVFGEIGFSPTGISALEEKVARAVAKAQVATRAPIITHTYEGLFAEDHTDFFLNNGVNPAQVAVGHMDCNNNLDTHEALIGRGCYIAFDRIGILATQSDERRAQNLVELLSRGYVNNILLSGDLAKQSRLRANGGRGYSVVLEDFVNLLIQLGVSDEEISTLTVANPRRFLEFSPGWS